MGDLSKTRTMLFYLSTVRPLLPSSTSNFEFEAHLPTCDSLIFDELPRPVGNQRPSVPRLGQQTRTKNATTLF